MIGRHSFQQLLTAQHWPIPLFLLALCAVLSANSLIEAAAIPAASAATGVDLCKRQPFRGRCPPGPNGIQMRSQFVLRYYLRNGECISYPYGHCVSDENEPRLYRYKEECEDACPNRERDATYATVGPKTGGQASAATPVTPLMTVCQQQRQKATAVGGVEGGGLVRGAFVPECSPLGTFVPLQCEPGGTECFCVDAEGIELKHSRTKDGGQKPDCEKIASAPAPLTNECTGPAEAGPCMAFSQRWHFDENGRHCVAFNYSGCGGNGNNYISEQACKQRCETETKCDGSELPLKDGNGQLVNCSAEGNKCPIGFNCHSIQQTSVCCPNTRNEKGVNADLQSPAALLVSDKKADESDKKADESDKKADESDKKADESDKKADESDKKADESDKKADESDKKADESDKKADESDKKADESDKKADESDKKADEDLCSLPKDRGPCDQYQMRFYFNRELDECKYFFYGGCDGNANNFARVEECEKACVGGAKSMEAAVLRNASALFTTATAEVITIASPSTAVTTTIEAMGTQGPPDGQTADETHSSSSSSSSSTDMNSSHKANGTEKHGNTTAKKQNLSSNRCQHPKDDGNCAAQFVRWFWNTETKKCEQFTYGGCNGNGNNFGSREECLSICHREVVPPVEKSVDPRSDVCESDVDEGQCGGEFMRYTFDRHTGECRQFQYGGCGGNGNNFASLVDCKRRCTPPETEGKKVLSNNICDHRIDPGECSGVFHRYGYDSDTNRCNQFMYGGCSGNGNNFATLADCQVACVRSDCSQTDPPKDCDLTRCQLVKDGRGCTLCSCAPTRHPPLIPGPESAGRAHCPPLDIQLCVEPCIIFLNRKGCQECVCPLLPPTPTQASTGVEQPPAPALPEDESVSVPNRPAPRPVAPALSPPAPVSSPPSPPSPPSAPAPKLIEVIQHGVPNSVSGSLLPPPTAAVTASTPTEPTPPSPSAAASSDDSPTSQQIITTITTAAAPLPIASVQRQQHEQQQQQQQQQQQVVAFGNNEICSQILDPGAPSCTRFVQRWYFNVEHAQCESFTYTGCAGNRNHFFSQKECQIYCGRFSRTGTHTDGGEHSAAVQQPSPAFSLPTLPTPPSSSSPQAAVVPIGVDEQKVRQQKVEDVDVEQSKRVPLKLADDEEGKPLQKQLKNNQTAAGQQTDNETQEEGREESVAATTGEQGHKNTVATIAANAVGLKNGQRSDGWKEPQGQAVESVREAENEQRVEGNSEERMQTAKEGKEGDKRKEERMVENGTEREEEQKEVRDEQRKEREEQKEVREEQGKEKEEQKMMESGEEKGAEKEVRSDKEMPKMTVPDHVEEPPITIQTPPALPSVETSAARGDIKVPQNEAKDEEEEEKDVEKQGRTEEEDGEKIMDKGGDGIRRVKEEEEWRRAKEEEKRTKEEEASKADEENGRRAKEEEEKRTKEEDGRKRAREEEAKRIAVEEGRRAKEEEERTKEEDRRKIAREEEARRIAVEEGRKAKEEEGKRRADEEGRRRADEEGRRRADEEGRRRADEEGRRRADEEGRRRADEEGRRRADEDGRRRADEEGRRRADEEGKRRADEEGRRRADEEGRRRADEEGRRRADEEGRRRADEEGRRRADEEGRRRADEEGRRKADEEERIRVDEEEEGKLVKEEEQKSVKEEEGRRRVEEGGKRVKENGKIVFEKEQNQLQQNHGVQEQEEAPVTQEKVEEVEKTAPATTSVPVPSPPLPQTQAEHRVIPPREPPRVKQQEQVAALPGKNNIYTNVEENGSGRSTEEGGREEYEEKKEESGKETLRGNQKGDEIALEKEEKHGQQQQQVVQGQHPPMWLFSVGRGAEGGRDGLHRLKIHSIEVPQVSTKSAVAAWNGTASEQPGRGPGRVTTIDLKELGRGDGDARHKGMEQQQRLQVPLQAGGVQIEKGAEGGQKNADKVESGRHREEQKEMIIENKEDNEKEGRTGGGKGEADDMIWLETESNKEAENRGKEKNEEKEESARRAKLDETATELESEGDDDRNEGEESEQVYIAPEEKPAEEERPKNSREWEGREKEKETDKKKKEHREVEKETEVLQSPIQTQNIPQQNVQTLPQQQFSQQQIQQVQLQHRQQAVPPQTQQTQGGQLQEAAPPQIQQVQGGQKYHVPLPKVQKIQRGQSQHALFPQIQQVQGKQPQQTLSLQDQQVQAGQPHEALPPQIQQSRQQQQDMLPQDQQVHGGEPQQAPLLQAQQIKEQSQQVPLSQIEQVQGGQPQKTPPSQAQQVNSGEPQQAAPPQTQQIQGRQPQEVAPPQVQQVQGGQRYHVRLPQVQQVQGRQPQQTLSLQAQQVQAGQPHEAPPPQIQQSGQQQQNMLPQDQQVHEGKPQQAPLLQAQQIKGQSQQVPLSQIEQVQGGQPQQTPPPQAQQVNSGQPQQAPSSQIQQIQGGQLQEVAPPQVQQVQGVQPQQALPQQTEKGQPQHVSHQVQEGGGRSQQTPLIQQEQGVQPQQAPPLQAQQEQGEQPQQAQIQQRVGEQPQQATPESHLSLQEPHKEQEQQQQHVQRQRLDLFQNISDHKTDVPHAASPHLQAAQQTQEIQSRPQHNDEGHQQIQSQNLDQVQSSSTPPLSPPNAPMTGNASSPLTAASVPVSGGEGALSDLFTLHHLQQQGGGGGGGGSGREEVARKMLPVWGGLIDDSSRLQPITLEEMQAGNSTETREEGGGEQLADGEEREAAGTEASPHQQQQAGRLAPTRADVFPHQQQMNGLAPTVPVGMQQDTALMTNGPAMASSGHTQQPPPTPALADPNTPPTVSARSPLPELVPLVRSSTVSPASPLSPPQQKALVPPIMPDTLENVRDSAEVVCSLPPDAGACRQYVPKWFFNAQTGLCEQFSFGGCQGNQNNFAEREQCETKCKKVQQLTNSHQLLPEKCSLEREEGTGGGYHVQWYFNVRNLRCEQFVWQGQSGNENRFSTNDECEAMCKFFQLPGVPHPQNVVTNARTPPALTSIDQQQKSREVGAVQAQNANDEGEDQQQQTEHENELPLAKAATIALTENSQGAIGMPALAQAIGEMPTLSAEPAAPAPAPASLQAPPSLPSSGTASGYSSYSAQPLPKMPQQLPANLPPMLGPSPPAVIDYQTGKRFDQPKEALASAVVAASPTVAVQSGLPNHVPSNKEEQNIGGMDQKGFGEFPGALETFGQSFSKEVVVAQPQRAAHQTIPVCPNGLNAMRYKDGRPVMCLPGMNQCPAKSVCFFNGLDYTCCPNEDDPYDQHVFGGYDGEELKHGYKSQQQQNSFLRHRLHHQHRRVRRGQQSVLASSAFSVDSGGSPSSAHSLRFDDKAPPARINQAIYRQHNLLTAASADLSPCVQPLRRGGCQEASLRYFYDLALDQCRLFYFSGCDGNENNFAKLADCETRCKIGLTANSAKPKLGLGPCPGAELPLGGKNPVLCGDRSDSIGCPSGYFCADGPPSVCCPGQKSSELRRKPSIGAPGGTADKQLEVKASNDEEDAARTMLADLPAICPDGSDPMKNDTSGELLVCGAGIELDGQAMCSRGFFCSINTDRNLRMCCPLVSQGSQLSSSSEIVAPHFGIRSSNPGEVVGQGSAPFDRRTAKGTPSNVPPTTGTEAKSNSQSAQPLDVPSQPASAAARAAGAPTEFAHLLIAGAKKGGDAAPTEQLKLAEPKEGEGDIGIQDPFEVNRTSKTESIQNFCRLRPIEGRQCRAGEPSPPSHLQYFFDSKERKCKVFFHRGCGGNANRFSTRQQCESRCGSARSRH
uniref:Uncharacterized protein n=1 Tax=Globodera rostochiensis TaxID=31243 RepID=A0A914HT32_GLORO